LSDAGREAVLGELGLIDARFRNLLGEVRLSHPEFMRPVVPAADLGALRSAVLDGETALCEYFAGAEASFLFTLTAEGLSVDRLPPRDELAGLVANYLRFLTLRTSPSFDAVAGGKRLHDLLIGPVRARLAPAVRRLVIVPDDSLWALPFEALVCCESAAPVDPRAVRRGGKPPARFLVEDLEVVYAPSARALVELFARPRSAPRSMDLLAVANAEAFLDRSLSSNARIDLPALASTEREIKAIRSVFPRGRTVLLVDGEATEAAFFRSPPAAFRVIHIAAHAVFDDQNWWRSAILLRPDEAAGADGLLQPLDIYLSKLSADLVVLSGCRTAVGQRGRADGVTGLVSGFLHAGARSVVSSLWSVEDESSARFMTGFYAALTDGASAAAALRRAKLALLKSDFGHPFHWAGFVLTGNYAARLE
jgi:CHAT domain-containing protein